MSSVNINLAADTILNVMVGQQDENEVREVVFDFSDWYTTYGSGTISLAIQRPKDEWPYEGTLTVDNSTHKATWEISDTDSAYAGVGQIQLSYTVGTAKKKSVVYRFTVHKSLGALGNVITPIQIQTFIDEVTEALEDMQEELADVKADLQDLQEEIEGGGSGVPTNVKQAIYNLFSNAVYKDYNATADKAIIQSWMNEVTSITLNQSTVSISGVGTQQLVATTVPAGATVTWSSSDSSIATVSSSGLISSVNNGTCTITATAGNKTATCAVTVSGITVSYSVTNNLTNCTTSNSAATASGGDSYTATLTAGTGYTMTGATVSVMMGGNDITSTAYSNGVISITSVTGDIVITASAAEEISYLYNWDLTQSLIDSVGSQEIALSAASGTSNPSRDSSGLHFTAATQYAYLGAIDVVSKTIEIDVASLQFEGNTSYHIRFYSNSERDSSASKGLGCIVWRSGQGWTSYGWSGATGTSAKWSSSFWSTDLTGTSLDVLNAFSGKTVKVVYHADGYTKDLYLDNVYKGTINDIYFNSAEGHLSNALCIAGLYSKTQSSGDQCYNMTITGIRIYANSL